MRRVIAAGWERFFAPQPLYAMVIARIGLGSIALLSSIVKLPDLERLFGPQGVGVVLLGSGGAASPLEGLLRLPFEIGSAGLVWALFLGMMLAALGFAVGAWTRASGIALLVLHAMFYARNEFAYAGSWASMYKPFLLYTLLAPSGRHLSVDAWRRARAGRAAPGWWGPAIPVRLLQTHICTMYAAAAWLRPLDPGWWRGEMVFAGVTDEWFGRLDLDWFPLIALLRVASYSALLLEILAPFLLWVPRVGPVWVLGLMAMHASLELLTNLGWWQLQMIVVLCVFLPAPWLARLFQPRAGIDPPARR